MGWLGDFIGGAVSAVTGGLIGDAFSSRDEQRQADISDSSWQFRQQNAHQFEVEDLKKAGLNPLLTQGGNMASGASVSSSGTSRADILNAYNTAKQLQIEHMNAFTNRQNADTNSSLGHSTIDLNKANIGLSKANEAYTNSQTIVNKDLALANIANSTAETNAKIDMYAKQGDAALINAAAASAQASHRGREVDSNIESAKIMRDFERLKTKVYGNENFPVLHGDTSKAVGTLGYFLNKFAPAISYFK